MKSPTKRPLSKLPVPGERDWSENGADIFELKQARSRRAIEKKGQRI
jgi:hypothetical protein